MRVDPRGAAFVALTLSVAGVVRLPAQESVLLRYHPSVGRTIRTVAWTDIAITVGDVDAGATDTLHVDVSQIHSVTGRVEAQREGRYVVRRTLDSVRTRRRAMGGAWRPVEPDSGWKPPTARMSVGERLQTADFELIGGDTSDVAARGWLRDPSGRFEMPFPEGPITVGEPFSTELVLPFASGVPGQQNRLQFAEGTELVAQASVTLDSLVPRGADTLAYVRASGSFLPVTVTAPAEFTQTAATITGAFAGRLIWSTAWSAWVSGATRSDFRIRLETEGAEPSAAVVMRVDARSRFQVRP